MQEKVSDSFISLLIEGRYSGVPERLENSLLLVSTTDSRNKHYFEDHIDIVKMDTYYYMQA